MPEEINRMVTDSIADLLFVTEPAGERNLLREGHAPATIKMVGNVMIDSLLANLEKATAREKWRDYNLNNRRYALVTLHRPSNVDSPARLQELLNRLICISRQIPLVFPVHPRTRKNLDPSLTSPSLSFCDPLGYMDFLSLIVGAKLVITDSGGIQEETTALRVPCLTLRNNTERPITTETGTNTLIGEDSSRLDPLISTILVGTYKTGCVPPLWDGKASHRIVQSLAELQ
jgi:UDP-N-acetylglucosamine 2-epimerase (non-hydrolysing)